MAPESSTAWHSVNARHCDENGGRCAHLRIFVISFLFQDLLRKTNTVGFEPTTTRLTALRSVDLARRATLLCWFYDDYCVLHLACCTRGAHLLAHHQKQSITTHILGHTPQYTLGAGYAARAKILVPRWLEPRALLVLAVRSNQLSYETIDDCRKGFGA
jgi:hypothetical protein